MVRSAAIAEVTATGRRSALVSSFMSLANVGRNRHAIAALDVADNDQVLAIGFGPGEALAELTRREP